MNFQTVQITTRLDKQEISYETVKNKVSREFLGR